LFEPPAASDQFKSLPAIESHGEQLPDDEVERHEEVSAVVEPSLSRRFPTGLPAPDRTYPTSDYVSGEKRHDASHSGVELRPELSLPPRSHGTLTPAMSETKDDLVNHSIRDGLNHESVRVPHTSHGHRIAHSVIDERVPKETELPQHKGSGSLTPQTNPQTRIVASTTSIDRSSPTQEASAPFALFVPAPEQVFLDSIAPSPAITNRRAPEQPSRQVEDEPIIQVTIGSIEVRPETTTAPARKSSHIPSPVMGLDEYLCRKNKRGVE
jgi:hypothetical protein